MGPLRASKQIKINRIGRKGRERKRDESKRGEDRTVMRSSFHKDAKQKPSFLLRPWLCVFDLLYRDGWYAVDFTWQQTWRLFDLELG